MSGERGETLTDAMLADLPAHLRPISSGKYLRAGCPFHGSEHQRSLSINTETNRFHCFSCDVWGYTEQAREQWKAEQVRRTPPQPWQRSSAPDRLRPDADEPEPLPADWLQRLGEWQADLPRAAAYLAKRCIPLELVQRLGAGVGDFGGAYRLILPHTDPQGRIVSLYGRRIDGVAEYKHHHIKDRAKGFLNAPAVNGADEVWIAEGAFDALALIASGIPHAVAVFGIDGIRWGWLKGVRRIVLAFDCDEAGRRAIEKHARQALMRGVEVLAVMPEELGGAKDVAEAWAADTFSPYASQVPEQIREAWLERVAIKIVDAGMPLAQAEHSALRELGG